MNTHLKIWDEMVAIYRLGLGNKGGTWRYEDLLYCWQQVYPDLIGPALVAHGD